jgi:hypothetical protein
MGAVDASSMGASDRTTASKKVKVHLSGMALRGRACGAACTPTLHSCGGFSGSSREPAGARIARHAAPGNKGMQDSIYWFALIFARGLTECP